MNELKPPPYSPAHQTLTACLSLSLSLSLSPPLSRSTQQCRRAAAHDGCHCLRRRIQESAMVTDLVFENGLIAMANRFAFEIPLRVRLWHSASNLCPRRRHPLETCHHCRRSSSASRSLSRQTTDFHTLVRRHPSPAVPLLLLSRTRALPSMADLSPPPPHHL
ncbi:hypothetical protein CsSME_00053887 [Camellia sinensis var. sinensis]